MIKNERQYRITQSQVVKLERALDQLDKHDSADAKLDPTLRQIEQNSLHTLLAKLNVELQEYRTLQSGKQQRFNCDSFLDLPNALIKARIASKLSQKELAERLGVKPQQVQHYEATKYAGASFVRLQEVMEALGLNVSMLVALPSGGGGFITADKQPSIAASVAS